MARTSSFALRDTEDKTEGKQMTEHDYEHEHEHPSALLGAGEHEDRRRRTEDPSRECSGAVAES